MNFIKRLFSYDTPGSFVNNLRKKRFSLLRHRIEQLIDKKKPLRILDIGGDIGYWKNVGWNNSNSRIYLLNLYENSIPEKDSEIFHTIIGNALNINAQKGDYDLVFSNSVIEHVGSYDNQVVFAQEINRISDRFIIQTPSYWFPLEPHCRIPFFQFLPHSVRARLIMRFNINYFPKAATYQKALVVSRSTLMLSKKQFKALFPDAEIHVERLLGIPKSYTAVKL